MTTAGIIMFIIITASNIPISSKEFEVSPKNIETNRLTITATPNIPMPYMEINFAILSIFLGSLDSLYIIFRIPLNSTATIKYIKIIQIIIIAKTIKNGRLESRSPMINKSISIYKIIM